MYMIRLAGLPHRVVPESHLPEGGAAISTIDQ